MPGFGENPVFEGAASIGTGMRIGIGDLPSGPEPGPQMPKKKRPPIN